MKEKIKEFLEFIKNIVVTIISSTVMLFQRIALGSKAADAIGQESAKEASKGSMRIQNKELTKEMNMLLPQIMQELEKSGNNFVKGTEYEIAEIGIQDRKKDDKFPFELVVSCKNGNEYKLPFGDKDTAQRPGIPQGLSATMQGIIQECRMSHQESINETDFSKDDSFLYKCFNLDKEINESGKVKAMKKNNLYVAIRTGKSQEDEVNTIIPDFSVPLTFSEANLDRVYDVFNQMKDQEFQHREVTVALNGLLFIKRDESNDIMVKAANGKLSRNYSDLLKINKELGQYEICDKEHFKEIISDAIMDIKTNTLDKIQLTDEIVLSENETYKNKGFETHTYSNPLTENVNTDDINDIVKSLNVSILNPSSAYIITKNNSPYITFSTDENRKVQTVVPFYEEKQKSQIPEEQNQTISLDEQKDEAIIIGDKDNKITFKKDELITQALLDQDKGIILTMKDITENQKIVKDKENITNDELNTLSEIINASTFKMKDCDFQEFEESHNQCINAKKEAEEIYPCEGEVNVKIFSNHDKVIALNSGDAFLSHADGSIERIDMTLEDPDLSKNKEKNRDEREL